jgi:hypothetical protein
MIEFRITKYNPAFRAANGAYQGDDWTSISDIGKIFNGIELTRTEYERVEHAYVTTALKFLQDSGISSLKVSELENNFGFPLAPANDEHLSLSQITVTLSSLLREAFWCKLECPQAFIHVGYDYCMYVGVPNVSHSALEFASNSGLFVELFESPYKNENTA